MVEALQTLVKVELNLEEQIKWIKIGVDIIGSSLFLHSVQVNFVTKIFSKFLLSYSIIQKEKCSLSKTHFL